MVGKLTPVGEMRVGKMRVGEMRVDKMRCRQSENMQILDKLSY